MIKTVTVSNNDGVVVEIALTKPKETGFIIRSIDGLGPPKANVNTTSSANLDGSSFNSAFLTDRNIVLDIVFDDSYPIEFLRQKTYDMFPLKQEVRLDFVLDRRNVYAVGYVESNEPDIFSDQESTQISILCPDPFFRGALQSVTLDPSEARFEFPYSNESLDSKLTEFSELIEQKAYTANNEGGSAIGFTLEAWAANEHSGTVYVRNPKQDAYLAFDTTVFPDGALLPGDHVVITTQVGSKRATLYRGIDTYNILGSIVSGSKWLQLDRGVNTLEMAIDPVNPGIDLSITYQTLYEGI